MNRWMVGEIPMTTNSPAVPALNRDCKRLLPKTSYLWPDIHSLLNCAGILSAYNYA